MYASVCFFLFKSISLGLALEPSDFYCMLIIFWKYPYLYCPGLHVAGLSHWTIVRERASQLDHLFGFAPPYHVPKGHSPRYIGRCSRMLGSPYLRTGEISYMPRTSSFGLSISAYLDWNQMIWTIELGLRSYKLFQILHIESAFRECCVHTFVCAAMIMRCFPCVLLYISTSFKTLGVLFKTSSIFKNPGCMFSPLPTFFSLLLSIFL